MSNHPRPCGKGDGGRPGIDRSGWPTYNDDNSVTWLDDDWQIIVGKYSDTQQ